MRTNLAANQFEPCLVSSMKQDRESNAVVHRQQMEGMNMKTNQAVSLLFVILLAASLPVCASNSHSFALRSSVTINGAVIPPGIYQLSWDSHRSNVNVTFSKDGQFVA